MTVRGVDELSPETASVVEEYLAQLDAGLCRVRRALADDVLAEIRTHFLDELEAASTAEDARAIAVQFGEPDEYAVALCAEIAGRDSGVSGDSRGSGTILGMPYELRVPTAERVRLRWWNPADPHVFVPRVFGLGWDINFGALAVRLRLIRPDDEEVPFASVPEVWMWAALAVPVAITLGMALWWWLASDGLPASLPIHWGITGEPDRFSSAGSALGYLMVMAGVPTVWACWTFVKRRDGSRAIVSAFASLFAALSGAIFTYTLLWASGDAPGWSIGVGILGSVAVPFAMLVVLARVNRREEWRKGLDRTQDAANMGRNV